MEDIHWWNFNDTLPLFQTLPEFVEFFVVVERCDKMFLSAKRKLVCFCSWILVHTENTKAFRAINIDIELWNSRYHYISMYICIYTVYHDDMDSQVWFTKIKINEKKKKVPMGISPLVLRCDVFCLPPQNLPQKSRGQETPIWLSRDLVHPPSSATWGGASKRCKLVVEVPTAMSGLTDSGGWLPHSQKNWW